MALRPKILVMDEPTSELDPLGKYEIITIAKELNREHKITIVLVEHETELAANIIDRLIVLNQGQIEFQGTPVELFGNIELMQKAGLFVPEVTEVARGLANSGFEISKLPITYAQGSSLLKALMKERGFGHG